MLQINELFRDNRFPTGWKLVPCLIYLPIGVILAIIRLFIGIHAIFAASLLPKLSSCRIVVLRVMCAVLGVVVRQESIENHDKRIKVIVSNHISIFDHLAIHLVTGSISVNVWELPHCFHHALSLKDFGKMREKDTIVKNIKQHLSKDETPVDIQPEGDTTSGENGLLRFASWPFSLGVNVQPVTVKIWRPIDVSPSVVTAPWFSDLFWFLFVPFTVFTIKYLPVVELDNDTNDEEKSKLVENIISSELDIKVTNFTNSDKSEYIKRLLVQQQGQLKTTQMNYVDPVISQMSSKVKEILPHVPLKIIVNDLSKTRNVDTTVGNFLEGLVEFTPEEPTVPVTKTSLEASPGPSDAHAVKNFPKSAQDRMLSFQERKARLIESARKKYMEKHTINVINNS